MKKNNTFDKFLIRCREIHGYEYDYSHFKYIDYRTPSWIICNKCGCAFKQSPNKHLSKRRGCPICNTNEANKKKRKTTEEFINRANKIFNSFYIYTKTIYVKAKEKVIVTCPIHGDFEITPNDHLNCHGCSKCCQSSLERKIELLLKENNIEYIHQCNYKTFPWLGKLKLDFYLPKQNIAIECQGSQHFIPIEHFGGDNEFEVIKERDNRKYQFCKENNLKILYFAEIKEVDYFLGEKLIKNNNDLLVKIKK